MVVYCIPCSDYSIFFSFLFKLDPSAITKFMDIPLSNRTQRGRMYFIFNKYLKKIPSKISLKPVSSLENNHRTGSEQNLT